METVKPQDAKDAAPATDQGKGIGHRHALTRWVIGKTPEIELTEEEVEALGTARLGLLGVLAVEEKFDLLVSNYTDFERQLLEISLHNLLHHERNYTWWRHQVREAIRYFANTLFMTRLYRDQTIRSLGLMPVAEAEEIRDEFKAATNTEYDAVFGFRLLEALRNLMQHRALYSEVFVLPTKWEEQPDEESGEHGRLSFGTDLPLNVDELLEDRKLKKEIRDELSELMEPTRKRLGLRGYLREYVSAWFRIHRHTRELLSEHVAGWDEIWERAVTRGREADAGPGLAVVRYANDSRARELKFYVGDRMQEERRHLENRNLLLQHLGRQFVTGHVAPGQQY